MLIDHPDFKPKQKFEYYFLGEAGGRYCQFMSDRELTVGSVVVIDDLFSTHIFKVASIEIINANGREMKVAKFEDFQVALCRQTLIKV